MKKIARKIIHYVGEAVKVPDVEYPMVAFTNGLRDIADEAERIIISAK